MNTLKDKARIDLKDIGVRVFFSGLIIVLGVIDIGTYYAPTTGVDDIGYWSIAYYLAFGEAKNVAGTLSYYSYGYSMLIAPLVKLIHDEEVLFKSIIILNTVLNAGSFFFLTTIVKRLFNKSNPIVLYFFCFVSMQYASHYTYSKIILSESYLVFVLLILVYCILELIRYYSFSRFLISTLVCVYLHYIHQRGIVVLIAFLALVVVLVIKRIIPPRDLFFVGLIAAAIIGCAQYEKKQIITHVFQENEKVQGNDYSSRLLQTIRIVLDDNARKYFILAIFEKLFYFLFSTLLIGGIGVWGYIHDLKTWLLQRSKGCEMITNIQTRGCVSLFLILTWIGAISVASIAMYGSVHERFELAVYGRYIEYIYPMFLIRGLYEIYGRRKNMVKQLSIMFAVMMIGLLCTEYHFIIDEAKYSGSWMSPATFRFFYEYKDLIEGVLVIKKVTSLCFVCVLALSRLKKTTIASLLCSAMCIVFWGFNADGLRHEYVKAQKGFKEECESIIDIIRESNNSDVFIYATSPLAQRRVRGIQFMCSENNMFYLDDVKMFNNNYNGGLILCETETEGEQWLIYSDRLGELVYRNNSFLLVSLKPAIQ